MSLTKENGAVIASGLFPVRCGQEALDESFQIEIHFPINFPKSYPKVKILDGRIPNGPNADWHIETGNFACLNLLEQIILDVGPASNFSKFLDKTVNDYFIQQTHKILTGKYLSAWDHGTSGKLEFFSKLIPDAENDPVRILGALALLAKGEIKGHYICPFCSGKKVKQCHRNFLTDIKKLFPNSIFETAKHEIADLIKKLPS